MSPPRLYVHVHGLAEYICWAIRISIDVGRAKKSVLYTCGTRVGYRKAIVAVVIDLQMRIDACALRRVTGQHELTVRRRVALLQ
jgi:hypothetical protein